MILVDSSVWVAAFDRDDDRSTALLRRYLENELSVAVTPDILREVLQGARNPIHLASMRRDLEDMIVLLPRDNEQTYIDAAQIYARCRWEGITPRTGVDCLIVQMAIEHDLPLLQNDRDFGLIQKVVPALRLL